MKKIALLALCMFYGACVLASPALKIKITARQPDGVGIVLVKGGDEHIPYYITLDGYIAVKDVTGAYRYASAYTEAGWVAGDMLVHNSADRCAGEIAWLEANGMCDVPAGGAVRQKYSRGVAVQISNADDRTGNPVIPVVLVQYSDVKFTVEDAHRAFDRHFNAENYTAEGGRGSVRDYFVAQSMGKYSPSFDVLGVVTLPESRSYYGRNSGANVDVNVHEMVRQAVSLAESNGADFSKYRTVGGDIPVVGIVYAGVGEHSSDEDDAVWAMFTPCEINTGGGTISSFLVTNELFYNSSKDTYEIDGIGVFCHEFSHFLGLPDFYNTNSRTDIFGLSFWSIMDYGQYWADGKIPVGYTAYERAFMGWLDIDTLETQKQLCSLNALGSESQNAYYIFNDNDVMRNEYYILENRQPSTWFPTKLGSGMLVFHVDYSYSAWENNEVNNIASRQRMTIIPADGTLVKEDVALPSDYAGDFFPGTSGNTSLGDNTTPAFAPYRSNELGKFITSITETDGKVSFCYMARGVLEAPKDISLLSENGTVKISWEAVENAETYHVEVVCGGKTVSDCNVTEPVALIDGIGMEKNITVKLVARSDDYVDSPVSVETFGNPLGIGDNLISGDMDCCDVYSVEGILLRKGVNKGELRQMFPEGVYVLRFANGNSEKIIVF